MTQRGRAGKSAPRRPGAGRRDAGTRDAGRREPAPPPPRVDKDRLREVVEPVVAAAGYDLEDLTVSRAGRRHVVRVLVDADGGIDLDAVAIVSRSISAALDAAEERGGELLTGEYQLEVGSPGVDRPLRLPRHWRRNVGRLVAVPVAGRPVTGRVVAADADGVVLDADGTTVEAGWADLGPGRVQVEFNRVDEADLGDEADVGDEVDVHDEDEEPDDEDDVVDDEDVEDEGR
jgi:ribosome maturation factor RimP